MVGFSSFILLLSSVSCVFGVTIQEAISQQSELSILSSFANQSQSIYALLDALNQGGTFLAPTNEAITKFASANNITDVSAITEATLHDLVSYHILNLTLQSADLSKQGGVLANTALISEELANLKGAPQVVFASAYGSIGLDTALSNLKVFSGVGEAATVAKADIRFDKGFVHTIDSVLNFPVPCTKTAESAGLSTLLNALQTANLTEFVDTTAKFTCFAPTDEAFQAAGIDVKALSQEELVNALKYHSIVGDIGYSTAFEDGKQYQTLLDVPVTVHKREGQLFINDVAVQQGNVIMTNGVAQVLGGVLSPAKANATASSTASGSSTSTRSGSAASGSSTSPGSNSTTSSASRYSVGSVTAVGVVGGAALLMSL